jgi:hypothetical protein
VTIEDQKYEVRTVTQWNGGSGTINTKEPINTRVQYKPGPTLQNPLPEFADLAERTDNKSSNNGWSFRPIAGPGFKKELVKTGPTSLSSQLDTATQNAVSKDAQVPLTRAQQALSKVTPTKTNQALSAPNQDPSAAAANQNASQATQDPQKTEGNTTASEFNQEQFNKAVSDGGVRGSYGDHRYPIDADFGKQDCIKFSMYRYTPKKFNLEKDLGGFTGSNIKNKNSPMGTVTLPIQPSITDSNVVSWGESQLNAIEATAGAAALAGIAKGPEGVGQSAEKIIEGVRNNKEDIKSALAAHFAGQAAGANTGFLTRATGAILNNNLELLFQGPSLRSFTFTFSLSAREDTESKMIRKIIRLFKQGMSVKRSSSALFLKTPNIFDIEYLHNGKKHPYINQIKTCVLQNFTVNYTPAGNYATYEDGAMTQYDLTLTFGEIEPLFDDDYPNDGDATIGY